MKLIIALLCVAGMAGMAAAAHWDYADPSHWEHDYPACGGSQQSPINIVTADAVADTTLPKLKFSGACGLYNGDNYTVTNTGHSFKVTLQQQYNMSAMSCSMAFGDDVYGLVQLHFHMASEHKFDGLLRGMVAHMVFAKSDDSSKILVVGVTLTNDPALAGSSTQGALPNMFLSGILPAGTDATRTATYSGSAMPFESSFISTAFDGSYFNYMGSFTTPPCTEGVTWVVLRQPTLISRSAATNFFNAMKAGDAHFSATGNIRPVQPLHGRTVRFYPGSSTPAPNLQNLGGSINVKNEDDTQQQTATIALIIIVCFTLVVSIVAVVRSCMNPTNSDSASPTKI